MPSIDEYRKSIESFIDSALMPSNTYASLNQFKEFYKMVPLQVWHSTDLAFDICNYILRHRPELLALAIRLNVQVNLFLRSISKYAINHDIIFNKIGHKIGSFALTEEHAGVLSGLIVETTFDSDGNQYILNSEKGSKNWISQGMYADYVVVYASDKDDRSQVRMFLVDMNNETIQREKIESIEIAKTLDLAKLHFNNTIISQESILGNSCFFSKMDLLEGIFYGRYMIAEATVSGMLGFINHIKENIEGKKKFEKLGFKNYLDKCEFEYQDYMNKLLMQRQNLVFEKQNLFLINCYKIYVVEKSIEVFNNLSLMFGMKAATAKLTYANLLLHKVAEGDTYVLRMSLIHNLQRNGTIAVLSKPGFSWGNIFYILTRVNSSEASRQYVISKFKEISNRIIHSHIPLLKI